jgi:hypothetical protein
LKNKKIQAIFSTSQRFKASDGASYPTSCDLEFISKFAHSVILAEARVQLSRECLVSGFHRNDDQGYPDRLEIVS